ncbi:MAG TPA: methyltransferase [Polyangiaceae bacterium]|jgi:SAM-dependent methyltransferase
MQFDVARAFNDVKRTLEPALDIVAERAEGPCVPAWCETRNWADFLLNLSDAELERCEAEGLAEIAPALTSLPPDLLELATRVRESTRLPALEVNAAQRSRDDYRGVSARKRDQLDQLLGAIAPLAARATRIVDVGAGSGHFTRLAAAEFERATLGLERNPERVASAQRRVDARPNPLRAEFAVIDAGRDPLTLGAGDLAIGLHACGELGDTLVQAVIDSGAALALVSCCLQKIGSPERAPLSSTGLALPRAALGLSNLTSQAVGVEVGLRHTLHARQARYALRRLLVERGLEIPPGAEMRGINRRRALSGLADIAQRACVLRGLAAPTIAEISRHERAAQHDFARQRRLSLPRNMLARTLELAVVFDRALALREAGRAVRVVTLFERAVSPRNVALFAERACAGT